MNVLPFETVGHVSQFMWVFLRENGYPVRAFAFLFRLMFLAFSFLIF